MTEEQEAELRRYAKKSITALATRLINNSLELTNLAVDRARAIGVSEYGDTSYHKSVNDLWTEVDEELADALFYSHIIVGLIEGLADELSGLKP